MLYAIFEYPEAGHDCDIEYAKKMGLKEKEKYEVDYISMGQSYTSIYLKGIEGNFNSVQFEFQEPNGAPVNIYRDPRYNPYLGF